jgi:hypothetical protein
MDATRDSGFYGDANLAEFLRRPVKILDANWTVTAGNYQTVIDPWSLFLNNAQVKDRVEGYRMLQGTLNLRLAINGGPFFYGRAIAAYYPRQAYNDHSFGATTGDFYKMQLSMLPHVFLDPTSSEGGEIVCPFLCPDNWVDLIGGTAADMGRLHICSINDLLHANSSTGTVNLSVYAWMTNVRLAGPTTNPYATYTAHAGEELTYGAAGISVLGALVAWMRHSKCSYIGEDRSGHNVEEHEPKDIEAHAGDEYGTGIISKPASSIAKVAGFLGRIPAIKPYARPTEMVANAVGRFAHIFGFSRPAIVSDLCRTKIKGVGNMANTDQHEAVVKLSLDSKQELSIDPRTVGLSDVDEMSFDYIKQKEAFLTAVGWGENDAGGDSLGLLIVGPDQHNYETINTHFMHQLAPLYTLAAPFAFWRGSIKYRFQIVASQLHRGRLRFSYDPYIHAGGTSPDENETYSRIIDLATNRDFEMVVSWNHPHSWLRVYDRLGATDTAHPGGTSSSKSHLYHNGEIRIEVVNELTSPNPSLAQDVYINVFVSAGEDFEVAGPTDQMIAECEYEPQSGIEAHSGTEGEEIIDESDNIPESPSAITPVGKPEWSASPNSHVFFGESFASIRALLKRYNYYQTYLLTASNNILCIQESNFPQYPGEVPGAWGFTDATATPASTFYNYGAMTLLNWFTPCYVGWRGALRSKYVALDGDGTFNVRRFAQPFDQSNSGATSAALSVSSSNATPYNHWLYNRNVCGNDVTVCRTDGAAEVEFPFYSDRRFAPARRFLDGSGSGGNEWLGENAGHVCIYNGKIDRTEFVSRYVAAGDDFSLFMFIGQAPIIKRTKPLATSGVTSGPDY